MVSPSMLKPVVTVFVLILSSCSAEDLAEQLLTDFDQWVGPKLGINVTEKENFVEDQGRGVGSHGDHSLEGLHFEA